MYNRFEEYGVDLCPVCGKEVIIIGETLDGRIIGGCRDAFTREQWSDPQFDEDGEDE